MESMDDERAEVAILSITIASMVQRTPTPHVNPCLTNISSIGIRIPIQLGSLGLSKDMRVLILITAAKTYVFLLSSKKIRL
jgi:hypothetical protein